jgi:hypothetical protein
MQSLKGSNPGRVALRAAARRFTNLAADGQFMPSGVDPIFYGDLLQRR